MVKSLYIQCMIEKCPDYKERIEELPARWRDILKSRLGGETLEHIGACYDVTRERIRQTEARAVRQILGRKVYDEWCQEK